MATPEDPATAAERATDETTTAPVSSAAGDTAAEPAEPAKDQTAEADAADTDAADTKEGSTDEIPAEAVAVDGEVVTNELDEAEPAEAGAQAPSETQAPAEEAGAQASAEEDGGPLGAELEMLRKQLDEAQVDIKRVAAEYKNYRDRVKRDQAAAAELAIAGVLSALLPVLDDLDRARDHGDLTGPFGSVAEQLLAVVGKLGLTAFGAKGDPFDPNLHEAVAHVPTADAPEETCVDVMRRGYMLGERLLRPAMVAVAAPQE